LFLLLFVDSLQGLAASAGGVEGQATWWGWGNLAVLSTSSHSNGTVQGGLTAEGKPLQQKGAHSPSLLAVLLGDKKARQIDPGENATISQKSRVLV